MKRRGRGKKGYLQIEAAETRIGRLYDLAFYKVKEGKPDLARRYTQLAKKIGMRHTVRIPTVLKRSTCRRCMVPLIPGLNARIRYRNGREIATCLECGAVHRYPYKPLREAEE